MSDLSIASNPPPVVIETVPMAGVLNVDQNLHQVTVTYSEDMNTGGMSWVYENPQHYPELNGNAEWINKRTCIASVKLKPDTTYWMWFNKGNYNNFQSAQGVPALDYLLSFKTRG